jgi:CRP-like cAMP-binding protein
MTSVNPNGDIGNRLLCILDGSLEAILPCLHLHHAAHREVVAERGKRIDHVHFPTTCVLSVLAYMREGAAVEVGTIGNEGFFGNEALLGGEFWTETTVCQVEGDSLRMSVADFRHCIEQHSAFRQLLQRYLLAYLGQVSQSVACNRLHTTEERFARWMLMTHDRVRGDQFHLTQEFIADMLGVHRPTVSLVAGAFQQAGLLRYSRGNMTILNRAGLEDACCECYTAVNTQFDRLLGQPGQAAPRAGQSLSAT